MVLRRDRPGEFGVGGGPSGKGEPDPEPGRKIPLVGVWIDRTRKGGDLTITFTADGKLRFADGRAPAEAGWYKIGPGRRPPRIDYVTPARANPRNGRPPLLGIYRIDGDTLTLYLCEKERPTKFEAPEGSGIMVYSITREKKE